MDEDTVDTDNGDRVTDEACDDPWVWVDDEVCDDPNSELGAGKGPKQLCSTSENDDHMRLMAAPLVAGEGSNIFDDAKPEKPKEVSFKGAILGELTVNINRLPLDTLNLIIPFHGFSYNPATKTDILRLKGLPSRGFKFEPFKRNLLDRRVLPRKLAKLKITIYNQDNSPRRVVLEDNNELLTPVNSSKTPSVSQEETLLPSANNEMSSSKNPVELVPSGSKRCYSNVEMSEQQNESLKSTSDVTCGLKVKTFGKLDSPNVLNASTPKVQIFANEREPKSSEKGSQTSKMNQSNVNSTPSLSDHKVTITPGFIKDPSIQIPKPTPSLSISPTPKQGAPSGLHLVKKPTPHNSFGENKQNSINSFSKILRPLQPTVQSCSTHCEKSSFQMPELSCNSCNSFFHPTCIGLDEKIDYSSYHFYCSVCSPPVEKKNSRPSLAIPEVISCADSQPNVVITQKSLPVSNISTTTTDSRPAPIEFTQTSSLTDVERPNLPRPIESQTIVNISGNASKNNASVLIQPAERDDCFPSDKAAEEPDIEVVPSPVMPTNKISVQSQTVRIHGDLLSMSEIQRVGSGYFHALLHVFQYLTIPELFKTAQVCKLWNEVAQHKSVWKSVSLSNIQVKNWERFLSVMEDKKVEHINFSCMVIDTTEKIYWIDHLIRNIRMLKNVTQVQFPKITPIWLQHIIDALSEVEGSKLTCITSTETAYQESGDPLDFAVIGKVNDLKKLRINSILGPLPLLNLTRGLHIFGCKFATTLNDLSILNTNCLTDDGLKAISELKNLEQLGIGNCHSLSRNFLTSVAKLKKLKSLRLENAITGDELRVLSSLEDLQCLEMVNNEFKPGFDTGFMLLKSIKHALVIPYYTEEHGKINRNLVDSLKNMQNISHFYLGFTREYLAALKEIRPNSKHDIIPFEEDNKAGFVSISKLSKILLLELPLAKRVRILLMPRKFATKQTLKNRKP